ncbi:GNAT family N-acetyltransferase [Candidatus Binatus sp.]|uniref:GNAT family N-acetyltransferase n=2 Tax=Candidatus Binatus sp. TaxID=2811406 RepID=UPI003C76138F
MSAPSIIGESDPPKAWIETIQRSLRNYNTAATGIVEYYPVVFLIKDASNSVSGGVLGNISRGWLHVRSLWVDKMWRGRGYATHLMAAAERYAIAKGCIAAFLQTASYEARPLYEKLGYRVFAELDDHPSKGHRRHFLAKQPLLGIDDGSDRRDRADIVMQPYASGDVMATVNRGIQTHANAAIGLPEQMWFAANFFLRSEDGEILGGALGDTWGLWLHVSDLWVDPALRGKGYATKLMNAIEQLAIQRGCTNSYLDTFSFQARPLYEKLGYKVFGTLENHPKGHSHYFLKKSL